MSEKDDFYVNDSKTGKSIFRSTMNSMSVQRMYSLQLNLSGSLLFAYIGSLQ